MEKITKRSSMKSKIAIPRVMTGSNAFILDNTNTDRKIQIPPTGNQEFKLTLTIKWEEFSTSVQNAGSLWLGYNVGMQTSELPSIGVVVPIETPGPECKTFVVVTNWLRVDSIYWPGESACMVKLLCRVFCLGTTNNIANYRRFSGDSINTTADMHEYQDFRNARHLQSIRSERCPLSYSLFNALSATPTAKVLSCG
jgi:hypothetical protein